MDDTQRQESGETFYRKLHTQSREIHNALNNRGNDNCKLDTRNLQSEMYWEIDRGLLNLTNLMVMKKQQRNLKIVFAHLKLIQKILFKMQFYMV